MTQEHNAVSRTRMTAHNVKTILICAGGVLLNLLLSTICTQFKLPLYLDTVGSVTVAVLGGYLPGVIVGFCTNICKSITDASALYYGILNVLIALFASVFAKKGYFKKPSGLPLVLLVFTLIGGGLGSLIPWYLDGLTYDAESLGAAIYDLGILSAAWSQVAANLLTDLADKAITIGLVLLNVHLIPAQYHGMFRFRGWMQEPLSPEETAAAKHAQSRIMSLQTKILLVLTVSLMLVSIGAAGISVHLYKTALIKDHIKIAEGAARIARSLLDPERIPEYLEKGEAAEGYTRTKSLLYEVRDSSSDIEYLYVYQIKEDGCHVVFDLDTDEIKGSPAGDIIPFDESFLPYVPDLLAGKPIDPIISNDSFGWLLTVYLPVTDASGTCCCYAAADVSMQQIGQIGLNFFIEMLSLFAGFFILIFCIVRWLVEYHIILPVNSIAISTGNFAYDSESARSGSIKRIRQLGIHTGDEVENLYYAIAKTSDDSMRYVADVQKKTEQISQMQRALIMVLADMVESRDKNTGEHIRKTAAYTEVIMRQMRKLGYYTDILTDSYVSDVINSAPLHDIGKINVPDAILNKPGRLSDDEYAIMKTHTTAGSSIISQAIALVPDSGYLLEAKNLAAYHHEKWDGSGYPNGIAGEQIPLSARIMAVADVFDALVSKRSYKEPFPIEEALRIIREGAGKHFDPAVVDAFLSAEAEVRKVEASFSQTQN